MIEDLHALVACIEGKWHETQVLVVGDVMLDRYIWGDVERISPEAPVPVVRAVRRSDQPGGAANVAMNIVGLGGRTSLVGFIGEDEDGHLLKRCLDRSGVPHRLTSVPGFPTTSKLRILGGQQQILRLDTENRDTYPAKAYEQLLEDVRAALPNVNAVVLSDYSKGVLTEEVCSNIIQAARAQAIPILVDPKHQDLRRYSGATTISPNLQELSAVTGTKSRDLNKLLAAAADLLPTIGIEFFAVTLSEKGIALVRPGSIDIFPAVARQVFDVSGAGDTVIATLALALSSGLDLKTAIPVANLAAGVVVSKVGTVPVTREELITALMPAIELQASEKLLDLQRLKARIRAWRSNGERIVFTNGCFDLLHVGHITLMEHARRQGDRLIVAINSDASVTALKGPNRPVVSERDRGRVLTGLAAVDAVIIFDQPTPLELIIALRPDVIVKGSDYSAISIVGAEEVRSWGGSVVIVPTVEGFSTTKLLTH